MLKTWSHSRMVTFELCPRRAKLQYIDRIPEPERHLPPGKTEHANDRGTRVHEAAERFVKGGVELIPELHAFREEFENLRTLYQEGKVSLEGEWGHDRSWSPVAWMSSDVWIRLKLDAMVRVADDHAVVIDFKTGKKAGNEIKHLEQGQLYAVATHARFPELEGVDVEFWYTDQNDLSHHAYTADEIRVLRDKFHSRGVRITSEVDFPPKPSTFNCKWCPYGRWGTNHCPEGIGGKADIWKSPFRTDRVGDGPESVFVVGPRPDLPEG